jgi:hypothetical protein
MGTTYGKENAVHLIEICSKTNNQILILSFHSNQRLMF